MGAVWLANLPAVLRKAGLVVEEFDGWETRSRSTGGYTDVWAIGTHHDGITEGVPEINRSRSGWTNPTNPNRPVGAVRLNKNGTVVVGCAGATNTQGRGGPFQTSKGLIPLDQGNLYAFSIEPSNNGVGEVWPAVQQDAYVTLCAAVMLWLKLKPGDIMAHFEWAPGRKFDPAGPSRYATGSRLWDMDKFRGDVWLRSIQLISEGKAWGIDPPQQEDYEMTKEELAALNAKLDTLLSQGRTQAVRQDWLNNTWTRYVGGMLQRILDAVNAILVAVKPTDPPQE